MAHSIIDDYKVFPRIMMLVVTILTYQSVHWFMSLDMPSPSQAGLVSVCMGALTGCFGIWMNKEAKTDRSQGEAKTDRSQEEVKTDKSQGAA